jgi:hypothetical protein
MSAGVASSRARHRALGWLANLLLAAASVGVVLALFEIGLRIAGFRAIYEMYSKPTIFWQHDPLLGWSHQPGAQDEYVGPRPWPVEFRSRVSINSQGLRGPELVPLPAGGRRILVLGDSMVAGFEVSEDATFTARLEDHLAASSGRPIQTVNAGVRGYGTDQVLLYYRERGRALRPDFVVFFYSGNDLIDNTTLHEMRRPFGKPAFQLRDDGSLGLVGAPVPIYPACSEVRLTPAAGALRVDGALGGALCRAQMLLFDHSALFSFLTQLVPWDGRLLGWLYYVGNPHLVFQPDAQKPDDAEAYAPRLTRALVVELAREVALDGAGFLVIGDAAQLEKLGRARLEAQGIEIVSLEAIETGDRQEIRFRRDSHYNAQGHDRLARFLAPLVGSRLDAREAGMGSAR